MCPGSAQALASRQRLRKPAAGLRPASVLHYRDARPLGTQSMAGTATEILAAMITPALLISASGTLVLSTSNRLSRVVDRVRVLARHAEQLQSAPLGDALHSDAKRLLITRQVTSLAQRAVILRSALAAFYLAIGLLVATSIAVGVLTWLDARLTWPV